jgi:predicted lipid-binding transport protein (Tim44 family)
MPDDAPKLHIDADWKEQAQAEKEKLSQKIDDSPRQPGPDEFPPADMRALVGSLASQALMGLGAYADPQTGRAMIDLMGSRFAIDLLGVLEEKTKGNLTPEEASELEEVLSELRQRFVQIASMIQQQMAKDPASVQVMGRPGSAPGATDAPAAGPRLVMPD